MGTAREPVAGSGDWPAWTARVANCCLASDMGGSFWGSVDWLASKTEAGSDQTKDGPNPLGPGPSGFENRLRLSHSHLKIGADRATGPTQTHEHGEESGLEGGTHYGQYLPSL